MTLRAQVADNFAKTAGVRRARRLLDAAARASSKPRASAKAQHLDKIKEIYVEYSAEQI